MTRLLTTLSIAILFCVPSFLNAQETFTDPAEWRDAICDATFVGGEFIRDEFADGPFFDLAANQTLDWGSIGTTGESIGLFPTPIGQAAPDVCIFPLIDQDLIFTPDPAAGNVAGFCFQYTGPALITIYDGSNVIDTIMSPPLPFDSTDPFLMICWSNSNQANVTRIELTRGDPTTSPNALSICGAEFAFGDGCDADSDPTCQDRLQGIIDGLYGKLDSASGYDLDWIEAAIYELECAQDPVLWETENRLSDYGTLFFQKNFYATYYLECVSDNALVEDCLIGIQDLLGCVVDAEIDYALENPDVDTNLLAYAEYFEEYADAFADSEMYLNAVLLHFYAWLFANHA